MRNCYEKLKFNHRQTRRRAVLTLNKGNWYTAFMLSDLQKIASGVVKGISGRAELVKKETSDKYLPPDTLFASISSGALVNGPIDFSTSRSERLTITKVTGLDNGTDGYLFHNGNTLTFKSLERTLFSAPLNELKVKQEPGIGLIFTLPDGRRFATGNSFPLKDDKFAPPFRGGSFGEEGPWVKELSRLNVISPDTYEKQANSVKKFWVFWIIFITLLTLAVVAL